MIPIAALLVHSWFKNIYTIPNYSECRLVVIEYTTLEYLPINIELKR